jgi:hypothetical protein
MVGCATSCGPNSYQTMNFQLTVIFSHRDVTGTIIALDTY